MDLGRDQPNWEPSIQRFLDFVRRNCELEVVQPRDTAEGIAEETRPFMPKQVIEKYFTDNRFREFKETYSALFPSSHDHCDPRRVLNKYTAVFCTLLQAGRGPYIKHFLQHHSLSDTALPFSLENPPANLPITPGDPNFLSDICNQQWRFCAPVFDSILNTNFESERVLPITSKTRLAGGGTAALWLIKLRDGYNNLSKAPRNTSNLFVLKEYSTNDAQKYYDNETAAFDKIKAHPHIIGYYGCFRRGGTFNVLLEYADKGTLKQFFERQAPPLGYPGLINFWKGQFNLIDALRAIHEVTPFSGDGPRIFQGWHQDVKPENILVVSDGFDDPSRWKFKLADLGISHFKVKISSRGDSTASDSYGTRTYGAPECFRPDEPSSSIKLRVKQNIDIWSLGCIFSETLRWIAHGHKGVIDFRQERLAETSLRNATATMDCFHDGRKVLEAVLRSNDFAKNHVPRMNLIIAPVILMINSMLDLSDRRPTAEILWREQLEIINSAEESHKSLSIQSSSRTRDWRQFNSNSGSTRSPKPPLSEPGAIYPPVLPPELRAMSLPNNHGDREISMGLGADTEDGMSSAILINEGIRHSPDEMSMCGEQDWNRPFAMQDQVSLATSNAHPTSTQRVMSPMVRDHRIISGSAWTPNPIGSLHHQTQRSDESNNPIGINGNPGYNKHAASDIRSPLLSPNTPENTHNGLHISYTGTKSSFDLSSLSLDAAHKQNKLYISTHQPALVQPIATVSQVTASTKTMTLEEALDWKSKCKSSDRLAPGLNWNLHNRLKGRDHVFLIDDSSSMEPHWPNLVRVFEALSYIVKQSDENGLDLFFSNSNNCEKDCKKTRKLLPIVRAQKQTQKKITTDINFRLSQILEKHKNGLDRKVWYRSKLKPLSLYILTDGVWETNCTAIDPIRNAVLKLHDLRIPSSQIGIQFISFGSDEVGLNRLAYLDDKLDLPKDIVDTEPWDGNVWKMLLGSINDNFDSQNRLKTLAEVHHNVA